jgi:surface polysaccharide O-acyltransferase-like enzyme
MTGDRAGAPAHPGRLAAYDVMRWLAIVMVVTIHVTGYATLAHAGSGLWALNSCVQAAVPAFVFITGALLWTRPVTGGWHGYLTFVRRRFVTIVVPYALWTVVYRLYHTRSGYGRVLTTAWWEGLGHDLLTGTAHFHLYFVPMIFVIYLVAPLAAALVRRSPSAAFFGAVGLTVVLWPLTYGVAVDWRWLVQAFTLSPFAFAGAWYRLAGQGDALRFPRAWPLMLAGGVLAGVLHPLADPGWQAAAGQWLPLSAERTLVVAFQTLTVLGLVEASGSVCLRRPGLALWAARTGPLVLGVYFVHSYVVRWLQAASGYAPWLGGALSVPRALVLIAASTVASASIAWVLSRFRATAWTVGASARHLHHHHTHARG